MVAALGPQAQGRVTLQAALTMSTEEQLWPRQARDTFTMPWARRLCKNNVRRLEEGGKMVAALGPRQQGLLTLQAALTMSTERAALATPGT